MELHERGAPAQERSPARRARGLERLHRLALLPLAPLAACAVAAHLLWGALVAVLLFPVLRGAAREFLVRFWSRTLLAIMGVRLEVTNAAPHTAPAADGGNPSGALLVLNHISWIDVFVVAAIVPARFVAKSEIAGWPFVGRFITACGTIFVERGRRHAVAHVNRIVAGHLRCGQSVGIFPEGTTTDGSHLLRFHANLVQAALDAPAPVVPVALQYRQYGERSDAAAFIGEMTLVASIFRILLAPRLTAQLRWLPAVSCEGATRQELARRAQEAIGAALDLAAPSAATAPADTEPGIPPAMAS